MRKNQFRFSVQKIYKKGSGVVNEDEILIKDNIFGVFDGATGLAGFKDKKGRTGGKIAALIAKEVFSENNGSLNKLANEANSQILIRMKKEGIDINKKEDLWLTTAAVVRLNKGKAECFQVADSVILIIYKNGFSKLLFKYINHDLKIMKEWKRLADKKFKDIWNKIKPEIKKLRKKANIYYGCLNGDKRAEKFFNFKDIKLDKVKSIVLFTDGLFIPKKDYLDEEDWNLLASIYQKKGLRGLLGYIRLLRNKNPNYWKYPGFKKDDDIAAIGIDF